MAYQVRTLKKRPNFVTRLNLGELNGEIKVKVNTREELLELLGLTKNVVVVVDKFLGRELVEFREIVWTGSFEKLRPHVSLLLEKLTTNNKLEVISREGERVGVEVAASQGLERLARDKVSLVRHAVAEHEKTPLLVLAKLARDEDNWVRLGVADNPNTSPEILKELAQDKEISVRRQVAFNKNTPSEILVGLVQDSSREVRMVVAGNPNTPPEILKELASDRDGWVKYSLARNPNTPPEILKELAADELLPVRAGVAENPSTPKEALVKMVYDHQEVRAALACNQNTPASILKVLVRDVDRWVRGNARSNPNLRGVFRQIT